MSKDFIDTFGVKYLNEVFDRKALLYIIENYHEFEETINFSIDNNEIPVENPNYYDPVSILKKYIEKSNGSDTVKVVYKNYIKKMILKMIKHIMLFINLKWIMVQKII